MRSGFIDTIPLKSIFNILFTLPTINSRFFNLFLLGLPYKLAETFIIAN